MGSHVAAPVLTPNTKYDSERDFVPIGPTANAPAVIVARKDFPAKDLRAFVDYLKANGDRVKQAHGGVGASSHMACLLFTSKAGVKPSLVAYRGTGPADMSISSASRRSASRRRLLAARSKPMPFPRGNASQSCRMCRLRSKPASIMR
jgi:tripartite-type tricarboxylate transporter receptor subunit TctC